MRKILTFVVAIVALATTQSVRAWNNIGHATIAVIAERNMTPEALEKCRGYLKHTMPYYASWMDYWRNCKGFEETNYWHGFSVDERNEQFPGDTRNAAFQIKRICKKMKKYNRMKDSLVCDNLKYLIHMVGDMHCPVHVKYVNEDALKQRSILNNGKKLGFHSFWDAAIGHFHKGMRCDEIAAKYDTLTDAEIAAICAGTPDDWAKVNAQEMREIYDLLPMGSELTKVSEENNARMREITIQQMLRGGYRLAHVMNTIFSK